MSNAPLVTPSPLAVQGVNAQIAFDVDPEAFPDGVEFLICRPGKLEPIGKLEVVRGAILIAMPPEVATNMRAQLRKAFAEHQKKQAEAVKVVQ
jgi:hypothetical protein